jgi:hypothetical protein
VINKWIKIDWVRVVIVNKLVADGNNGIVAMDDISKGRYNCINKWVSWELWFDGSDRESIIFENKLKISIVGFGLKDETKFRDDLIFFLLNLTELANNYLRKIISPTRMVGE